MSILLWEDSYCRKDGAYGISKVQGKEVTMKLSDIKLNRLVAEFIGTFILAFAVLASINGFLGGVPTPIVAGFALFLSVLAVGATSGSHINPAVTIALYSLKKIDGVNAVAYIIVQLIAGFFAALFMGVLLADKTAITLDAGEMWNSRAIFAESFGAAFFTFGIAAAIRNKLEGVSQAALIGGSLTLGIVFASAAGSLGVLNPAVAAGLSVFKWAYVIGPIIGAVIGANAYAYLIANKK